MPTKKTKAKPKKAVKKTVTITKSTRKIVSHVRPHAPFIGMLGLFAVTSVVAIVSFWSSTNDYIDHMFSSTLHANEVTVDGEVVGETKGEMKGAETEPTEIFVDVTTEHYNGKAIQALYHNGIMKGYDDGNFKPDATMNRAEFLTVVANAVDADFGGMKLGNCFTDVQDQWFAAFVCYAKEKKWMKGYEDGSVGPEKAITKAEALKVAFEALDYPICESVEEMPYDDVAVDEWYAPYACAAKEGRIIRNVGLFLPDYELTRAQLAQIVYNLMIQKGLIEESIKG